MERNQEFALSTILVPAVQFPMQRHAALGGRPKRERIKGGKAKRKEKEREGVEMEKVAGIPQNSTKR